MLDYTEAEGRRARTLLWLPIVLALREEMVALYWSPARPTMRETCDFFYARLRKKEQKLPCRR